ncbi:AI-2E family transporter [Segetibacter koreensis]|uniref:AI-2E family transporter n=1 Tax=Segetibacter koreensis TaxID=398037 RepID=UPI00036B86B7|nr:AI-2E family transporter [Segetibacter koreensis]
MQVKQYPFYIKSTVILFGIILVTYSLINLRDILVPVSFSVIIAILLNPLVTRFRKSGISHVLSIIISMLIALVVVCGILYFLSSQIVGFGDNLPLIKSKFSSLLHELQQWLQIKFGLTISKQVGFINEAMNSSKAILGQTVGTALGTLGVIFLLPVYVFLMLFYKTLILNFLYEVFSEENTKQVGDILSQTKTAIQSYMVGLLLEAVVVAVLNSIALLILGVDYAILLGVIGAILNMIPYLGGIIAIALPVLMATITKDGYSTQLGVIIAYAIIQFIDNNILVPRIVSSKVKINALFSILVVLLGGALWGVPGMFLSIPAVAILKIIFDRIDDLKPWGKLLGDEVPTRHKGQIWIRRKKNKSVAEEMVEQ